MTALEHAVAILLGNLEVKKLLIDAAIGFGLEPFECVTFHDIEAQFRDHPPTMAIIEANALREHPDASAFVANIERLFIVLATMDDDARHRYVGAKTTTFVCEPFDFSEVRSMLNAMREVNE